MIFNQENISFNDFLELLVVAFEVDRSALTERELETLTSVSNSHLNSLNKDYPVVFAFDDINGISYVLLRKYDTNETKIFSITVDDNKETSEHFDMLQKFRGLNLSEWYILQESPGWSSNYDRYKALSQYGLSDCIPVATDKDTDVAIWAEHNFSEDSKIRSCGGFLMDCERDILTYRNKEAAEDKIYSLLNSEYILSAGELTRPTYIITK